MLVLSRKAGEAILIGDNVRIVVRSIGKARVQIGIEAEAEGTKIRRAELIETPQPVRIFQKDAKTE